MSVWVEMSHLMEALILRASRSTWACELKWIGENRHICQGRHAPRERVSWNFPFIFLYRRAARHAPRERVSWNFFKSRFSVFVWSHAPRERVSWNVRTWKTSLAKKVTLHVSVWVEIRWFLKSTVQGCVTLHVSVWVEIQVVFYVLAFYQVTLHVSVWVEMTSCRHCNYHD